MKRLLLLALCLAVPAAAQTPAVDAARASGAVGERYDVAVDGLALFACAGRGLFESVEAGAPFDDQVTVAQQPDLFQLARLVDEHETAVVAVVDSNTARLFATRRGVLREVGGADSHPKYFRTRPMMGGLNQASYQRHNAGIRAQFARETAAELARLVDVEGASRVVLAPTDRPGTKPVVDQKNLFVTPSSLAAVAWNCWLAPLPSVRS